jgi:CheY-like chemotaxis protein
VPVVILTSSKENKDINRAYELGVNSYLIKPVGIRLRQGRNNRRRSADGIDWRDVL